MSRLILPLNLSRGAAPDAAAPAERDPEPPASVLRELQAEDPRWFLRFARFPKPHWDVCERWLPGDPKRARIQSGELPPDADFDMICYCPPDIRADDVVGYVRQRLVRVEDARRQAEAEQAVVEKANAEMRAKKIAAARGEMEHALKHTTNHERRVAVGVDTAHPMVPGADLT